MKTEKLCRRCGDKKSLDEFYFKQSVRRYATYCIECTSEINHQTYNEEKVMKYPNQYSSEEQKKQVFQFMENSGWIFMDDVGRWWKPGVKDINGTWIKQ